MLGAYPCPYRVADVDDLLTNTAGAAVGWLLGVVAMRLLPSAVPVVSDDLRPPSVPRRALAAVVDLMIILLGGLAAVLAVRLVVDTVTGEHNPLQPWVYDSATLVGPAMVVTLVTPLLRRDRATAGQAIVDLAIAQAGTVVPARREQVVRRFAVGWAPMTMLLALDYVVVAAALALAAAVVVLARRDDRSIAGVLAGTATVTAPMLSERASSRLTCTAADCGSSYGRLRRSRARKPRRPLRSPRGGCGV